MIHIAPRLRFQSKQFGVLTIIIEIARQIPDFPSISLFP